MFIPIYHPLHDIFKIHSEVTFFILFVVFLLIIWSADRTPKNTDDATIKSTTHWSTWILISHLFLHYVSFLAMPIFFNPEDEISIGLKEPIGPCNEFVPIQTAFGMVSRQKFFGCDFDMFL